MSDTEEKIDLTGPSAIITGSTLDIGAAVAKKEIVKRNKIT
jgi:hypothetical protein